MLPTDSNNLVYRAARRLFEHVGHIPPGLHLSCTTDIPLARGLGSSSSAIVGGLVAANQLTGNTLDKEALLAMAVDLEGHPDNVTSPHGEFDSIPYTTNAQQRYLRLRFLRNSRSFWPFLPSNSPPHRRVRYYQQRSAGRMLSSTAAGQRSFSMLYRPGATTCSPPPWMTGCINPTARRWFPA